MVSAMIISVSPVAPKASTKTIKEGVVQSVTNDTRHSYRVKSSTTKVNASINKSLYKSVAVAGAEARKQVYDHKGTVTIRVKSKSKEPQTLFDSVEKVIYAETSNVNQGDFMKWDVDETETQCYAIKSGSYYYYTFTVYITYLTTLNQREKLDEKVKEVISDFKFTNKTTPYTKVKTIYDYICKNVKYAKSNSDAKVYSAYNALINKKAVCQGYATLLYKMCRTVGVPTRVIAGDSTFSGEKHGWNIVKLGSYYYNVDSTWDSTLLSAGKNYSYFLKGDSFKGHKRWSQYKSYAFYKSYPMAAGAYGSKTANKASTKTKIAKFKNKTPKFVSVNRKKAVFKKVSGAKYQIKYSTVNNFKKAYTVQKNSKKTTYKFKSLKNNVAYFVKFRAYKKINKKKYYTKWSKTRQI